MNMRRCAILDSGSGNDSTSFRAADCAVAETIASLKSGGLVGLPLLGASRPTAAMGTGTWLATMGARARRARLHARKIARMSSSTSINEGHSESALRRKVRFSRENDGMASKKEAGLD